MTRILVVEDDTATRGTVEAVLKRAGYEVRTAAEGEEALKKLAEEPADIVLTDIFMQGIDGLETIRQVRTTYPATKIVAMTAYPERGNPLGFAECFGAHRTLSKPFLFRQLLDVLREVVGLSRLNGRK